MATLDPVKNLLKLTASTGYDQNATSIILTAGGSSLPSPSFNMTWWDSTTYPDPSNDPNAEIVRVTGVSGNTLTITRAQEGTAASTKNTAGKTYSLILGITAKMITDIGTALANSYSIFNVKSYGATGNGITDDSGAVQAAINAAHAAGGGTVYFPLGTYLCNTAITLLSNVKLEGAGFSQSIITCTGGNNLFTFSANISHLEFYNLTITATNGHIFYNTSSGGKLSYSKIHHCFFTQNSSSYCIWYQTNGNLIEVLFEENYFYTAGSTRTLSSWYLLDPSGSFNSNWWKNNTFEMESSSNQPVFYLECRTTNDYSYDNHWKDNVFEVANGGCIQLMSTFQSSIENCSLYDTTGQALPGIYLGKGSLGIRSTGARIVNFSRIGSNINGGVADIYLDSHTRNVVIDSCRATPDNLTIDCQGSSEVSILNQTPGTTVLNTPTGGFSQFAIHDNGGQVYDVMAYGAKGDGTTDDSAAIQAAISAAVSAGGGTVFFPAGTYLVNTAIQMYAKVRLLGQGYTSTITCATTNNLIEIPSTAAWMEFNNLRLTVTGTGGHIFAPGTNVHISASKIDHCWLSQNVAGKAIWYQVTGNLNELRVTNTDHYAGQTTRTMDAWHLIDTGGNMNSNWFENNVFTYGDTCNTNPFIYWECQASGDYSKDNHFINNHFETCDGGGFKFLSHFALELRGNYTWDNVALASPFIYIGKSSASGALATTNTLIESCGRIGTGIGGGVKDMTFEASTRYLTLRNIRGNPDNMTIEFNSCSDVLIEGISPGTTLTDLGAYYVGTVPGANFHAALQRPTVAITNTYTVLTNDDVIFADTTSHNITATLPTAVGVAGKQYTLKRVSGGSNTLTLATTSSQTIDGVTTQSIPTQYAAMTVVSDGANWKIIA